MEKISTSQAAEVVKIAAANLRALSAEKEQLEVENGTLREKLAHFEKKEQAERIAGLMEQKGINPENSLQEKVAGLMNEDDLDVVERAVGFSASQVKLAMVAGGTVEVEGMDPAERAAQTFANNIMEDDS